MSNVDIMNLEETFKMNCEKFEWYLKNVVNPGRVALVAYELNVIVLREAMGSRESKKAIDKQVYNSIINNYHVITKPQTIIHHHGSVKAKPFLGPSNQKKMLLVAPTEDEPSILLEKADITDLSAIHPVKNNNRGVVPKTYSYKNLGNTNPPSTTLKFNRTPKSKKKGELTELEHYLGLKNPEEGDEVGGADDTFGGDVISDTEMEANAEKRDIKQKFYPQY